MVNVEADVITLTEGRIDMTGTGEVMEEPPGRPPARTRKGFPMNLGGLFVSCFIIPECVHRVNKGPGRGVVWMHQPEERTEAFSAGNWCQG